MPSIVTGYEFDIFISYRQNDNKRDGWVTEFVNTLRDELEATVKDKLNIYFDENPFDGLGETHDVDDSLAKKLKCLIFIPIISKTYCDPNSFAWINEFLAFNKLAANDEHGIKVNLPKGNTASRVLPIKIHDIDDADKKLVENEIGFLRSIDFVYQSSGVNRPLTPNDERELNVHKTIYRDQINKVANAIQDIISGLKNPETSTNEREVSSPTSAPSAQSITTGSKSKIKLIIASIGVIVILVLAFFFYNKSTIVEAEIDKSIAVLPFMDMSQGGDQQYFADGVMEDILTQLQRMGELRVTSRTSVEQYRDTDKPALVIGNELSVSYLLEGSVRKAANQIMITAQLIKAGEDSHIWADNFTSEYTTEGLFDIQREIAENIVSELKLKIVPQKVALITKAQTENMEAYEHFQRGRLLYSQYNLTSNELGIEQLELAIQKDPKYAAVYGGLANAFMQRSMVYSYPKYWIDSAKVYANYGIELDNQCAECYKALGLVSQEEGRIKKALKYYKKTLAINPNFWTALSNSVSMYSRVGDYKSGLETLKKLISVKRDYGVRNIVIVNERFGNYETAQIYYEKDLELGKMSWNLGNINYVYRRLMNVEKYLEISESLFQLSGDSLDFKHGKIVSLWMKGRYQDVTDSYEELNEESTIFMRDFVADSYFKAGKIQESKTICEDQIDNIFERYDNNPILIENNETMANLATFYAISDQKEDALIWMGKAIDNGYLEPFSESFYDNIRDTPRFHELVDKQNKRREEVMELWATYNFPEPEEL